MVWVLGMATSCPVDSFFMTSGLYWQSILAVLKVTVEDPSAVCLVVETISLSLALNPPSRSSKTVVGFVAIGLRFHGASLPPGSGSP
jgi:hypothetical protein